MESQVRKVLEPPMPRPSSSPAWGRPGSRCWACAWWLDRRVDHARVGPGARQREDPVGHPCGRDALELGLGPVGDALVAGDLAARYRAMNSSEYGGPFSGSTS